MTQSYKQRLDSWMQNYSENLNFTLVTSVVTLEHCLRVIAFPRNMRGSIAGKVAGIATSTLEERSYSKRSHQISCLGEAGQDKVPIAKFMHETINYQAFLLADLSGLF